MDAREEQPALCVIRDSAIRCARNVGLVDDSTDDPAECRVVRSLMQLMALGLSAEEIGELDVCQPTLQAVCEYARLDSRGDDDPEEAVEAVRATIQAVEDERRQLDLRIEMLVIRKRALARRARVLGKIARLLDTGAEDGGPLAA